MSFSKRKHSPLESIGFSPATETMILAVLVGVLGSYGALFFKYIISTFQSLFWRTVDMSPESLLMLPWWHRVIVPTIGGLIVGLMIYYLAREAKGHGVPEVMAAVITNNSIIRPVVVIVKTFASAISISSGGSVGREGPIVQIGAAIASTAGQIFKLRPSQMKTIVGCGVAAGISATFNAPIAGTLFALELIVSDFGLTSFTPIIVAAVTSTAITRHYEGNTLAFILPQFKMVSGWELLIYLFLGLFAGLVGYIFTRSLYLSDDFFSASKIPEWFRPAIGGLVIGMTALMFPHIMGVGYETIEMLFSGKIVVGLMFLLVFLKIFATSITIGSGGSGGVFAPSLFMGAMLGGGFGSIVNMFFPEMTGAVGAYALVGMAAVNGACTLAPLSAIIILVELTNNYSIILPLMFTVVISTFVSMKLSSKSIYTEKLYRRGIQVHMGEDLNILRAANVRDIIRHDESVIHFDATIDELINLSLTKRRNVIFVIDEKKKYLGVISMQNLKHLISDSSISPHDKITDDMLEYSPTLSKKQTLDQVLTIFGESGFDRLPVVRGDNSVSGSVVISDVITQYNREVVNRNIAIELGAIINSGDQKGSLRLDENTVVKEVPVPHWLDGKAMNELGLRKKYGISVILVKEIRDKGEPRMVTPGSSYTLHEGDVLLVSGDENKIDKLLN